MAIEPDQRGQETGEDGARDLPAALEALGSAALLAAGGAAPDAALQALAEALAAATAADAVVIRGLDARRRSAPARAVVAESAALAAELEGSRLAPEELPREEREEPDSLPGAVRRAAELAEAEGALQLPIRVGGRVLGSIELLRHRGRLDPGERAFARLAASHAAVALSRTEAAYGGRAARHEALRLAGDALAAGADETRTAEQIALLAAEATGADACRVWRADGDGDPVLVASHGGADAADSGVGADAAVRALEGAEALTLSARSGGVVVGTLQLGQPPLGVLQLVFDVDTDVSEPDLAALATFGGRAAQALRAGDRNRLQTAELEQTRALLSVVGQAIAHLSLAHTLETATERVAQLLAVERLVVYLRDADEERLFAAAGRGVAGPHLRVGERLLELSVGPFRGRSILALDDARGEPALASVRDAIEEAAIEAVLAVPLHVDDDVIGLLAVYAELGRTLTSDEAALLSALAAQLAVAVQNARLHEQAKRLGAEREHALQAERQAARTVNALYEISRSFAQSLSLDATLEAVTRTAVELLGVDAAVLRMPDARGQLLVPRAVHVAEERLAASIQSILSRPQPVERFSARWVFGRGRPLMLDAETARSLGSPHELLAPFLEKGSTAAVVPVATQSETLGTLTILSLDPARPITNETVETARSLAAQAALALDNARLYQQQKDFADTMQRSLLPRARPQIDGLEIGDVYDSSARVDVGGDVYDFTSLADGRLAVVLGDVTGHGIDAAADMAMAKFVFRSLAREHSEPSDFLGAANEVVVDEIGLNKFITMLYLTIDPASGAVACASAGHPAPRVVRPDGTVAPLVVGGLALGIDPGQTYREVRGRLEPGAAVVLFTDGVIEARADGELYGEERLEALLSARAGSAVQEIAQAVLDDCRSFSGGELKDDCAVVVLRRTP